MADHVTHESVRTVSGTLARAGGTRRPEVRVTAADSAAFPDDEVVRIVLDGTEYRSRLATRADGATVVRGAYESPAEARSPDQATNHLIEWVDDRDLDSGRTVHVDIVEPEFKYGLRAPGETATYHATEPPSSSLADIAASLDDE
jgi:hypothetical protein